MNCVSRENRADQNCQRISDQQRIEPRLPGSHHLVDKNLQHGRHQDSGHDQQNSAPEKNGSDRLHFQQKRKQRLKNAAPGSPRLELSGRREGQDHVGKRFPESLQRVATPPQCRVIYVKVSSAPAFKHDVVVGVPEEDGRVRQGCELLRRHPVTVRFQMVVLLRRLENQGGFAPVPGNAAGDPQLLQRLITAIIGQDHTKACRAAFGRLHLEKRGHPVDR